MNSSNGTYLFRIPLIVFLFAFLFLKYVLQLFPGIGASVLLSELHHSGLYFGFLGAGYFYMYLAFQVPAGIIIDRYPLMRVVTSSSVICFLGAFLFLFSHTFVMMFMARMLMGLGAAFATVAYMKVAATYFSKKWFTRFSGLFGTACMGGAGTTLLVLGAADQAHGFEYILRMITFFSAAMVLIALLFWVSTTHDKKAKILKGTIFGTLKKIIVKPNNIFLLLYGGLSFSPVPIFGGLWGIGYLTKIHHLSAAAAHFSVSMMFYGFAAGGLLVALCCPPLAQQKRWMIGGILLAVILFGLLVYCPTLGLTPTAIAILMAGIGLCNSVFLLSYSMARQLNPVVIAGTVIAVLNMGDPLFGGIGEPFMGYIFDFFTKHAFSMAAYQAAFSILIAYWLFSCLFASFVRVRKSPPVLESDAPVELIPIANDF